MAIINTVTGGGVEPEKAGVLAPLVSGTITEATEKDLDGLTSIRQYAFYDCGSLEKAMIPEGVEHTRGNTFERCSALKEVSLPESLASLGSYDFAYCLSLESMTLPSGITRLPEHCFDGCSSLADINLDNISDFGSYCLNSTALAGDLDFSDRDYVNLSDHCFSNTKIASVNLGSANNLGNGCFYGCNELATVVFGNVDSLYIGDSAFSWCTKLTGLVLPDTVYYLGKAAFNYCTGLTGTFIIPAAVGESGDSRLFTNLFAYCSGLTEIQIPDSLKHISSGVFSGCSGLTSLTLPSSLETIGCVSTFYYCSSLEGEIDLSNAKAENVEGYSFPVTNSMFQNCAKLTSVKMPEGIISIGYSCFKNCTSLTSVTIPDGTQSIESEAFNQCNSLTSITIPDGVTSLGDRCFYNCTSLTSVTIPDGVTSLGNNCFNYCTSLTSVTIPDGVTKLGNYCFQYCSKLASVTMLPTTPPTLGTNAFNGASADLVITVPKGCLEAYKAATNWSSWADKMVEAAE